MIQKSGIIMIQQTWHHNDTENMAS